MTNDDDDASPAAAAADFDEASGPIIGRRRSDPTRGSFTLATYDSRDREQLHKLTARTDVDASSVFGYMSPKVSTARRVGALRSHLMRALVDDDGISVLDELEAVVPQPGRDTDTDPRPEDYVPVAEVDDSDDIAMTEVRYRLGDLTVWGTADAAETHAREHGSSLRRFSAIMDDDTLTVEVTALEGFVDWIGKQGSGDRPTKPSASSSRSRKAKARSAAT